MSHKFLRATAVKTGLIVLAGLIAAGIVLPRAVTLLIHARAGVWIDSAQQQRSGEPGEHFACLGTSDSHLSEQHHKRVEQAVQWLRWAARVTPNTAHTNYLLGQAYCLSGEFENAIEALEAHSVTRPANPLAHMERGFAYFSWAQSLQDDQRVTRITYLDRSIMALEKAGIGNQLLVQHGNSAFDQRNYKTAWVWYRLAEQHRLLVETTSFRSALLALAFDSEEDTASFILPKHRFTIEGDIKIQPMNFFRLGDGSPVRVWEIDNKQVSVFLHNDDPAGVLIEAVTSGSYCIAVDALDREPSPTLVEVSLDFEPIEVIELNQGDDTWHTTTIQVQLEPGWHLLSLRLANNATVNGMDRNGLVGNILIHRCE